MIWTKTFWKATAERAIRTAAQAAILVLGGEQINVISVDWVDTLGFAAGGAVLAVLTALVGSAVGGGDGPAFFDVERVTLDAGRHRKAGVIDPGTDGHDDEGLSSP